jgi:hypothetical protein
LFFTSADSNDVSVVVASYSIDPLQCKGRRNSASAFGPAEPKTHARHF